MIRAIDFVTALAEVVIEPGAIRPDTPAEIREAKIKSAIARLGERWVLAPTRRVQLQQLQAEGYDLV